MRISILLVVLVYVVLGVLTLGKFIIESQQRQPRQMIHYLER
jgi:hypothetical protein